MRPGAAFYQNRIPGVGTWEISFDSLGNGKGPLSMKIKNGLRSCSCGSRDWVGQDLWELPTWHGCAGAGEVPGAKRTGAWYAAGRWRAQGCFAGIHRARLDASSVWMTKYALLKG